MNKKIETLYAALEALKNNKIEYLWKEQPSCNCGIIAQCVSILPREIDGLQTALIGKTDLFTWSNYIEFHCTSTGEPLHYIFEKLFEIGLTKEDICDLEYLRNKDILKRANIDIYSQYPYYEDKTNLIKYIAAWIAILEENAGDPHTTQQQDNTNVIVEAENEEVELENLCLV